MVFPAHCLERASRMWQEDGDSKYSLENLQREEMELRIQGD